MASAFLVHSWLLLFAFGVVVVHLINSLRLATRQTMWFLKRGKDHPLQAIGFVSATAIFLVAASASVIKSLLG
jgi:hypothetical protein